MDPLTCPFCNPPNEEIVLANDLCYARYDKYPASPGHLLVIPFRHIPDFFDATDAKLAALFALVRESKGFLFTPSLQQTDTSGQANQTF